VLIGGGGGGSRQLDYIHAHYFVGHPLRFKVSRSLSQAQERVDGTWSTSGPSYHSCKSGLICFDDNGPAMLTSTMDGCRISSEEEALAEYNSKLQNSKHVRVLSLLSACSTTY
jgi:hypothetical protein